MSGTAELEIGLIEIRVFLSDGTKKKEIERFASPSPPRVGDHVSFQYWMAEVYRVEWTVLSCRPVIDVYCYLPRSDDPTESPFGEGGWLSSRK